ncbi:MAG: EF-P lysine aminoacylase GenX [Alphaproteobacteria bacterium]|nr:EF-P lysine aminoacylase GenX [Alphaproteobacteria bacterium]
MSEPRQPPSPAPSPAPSATQPSPPWHPERLAARLPFLQGRARLVAATRAFFAARGYAEVETPILQLSPGMEVHLHPFATRLDRADGGPALRLGLHTSPEFAMKKLIAGGMGAIFQLARTFRNAERSDTHHPEFTMLEWYRAGADMAALIEETEAFIRTTCPPELRWRGASVPLAAPFERLTVAEAFARYAGIDILATAPDPAAPDAALLRDAAARAGFPPRDGEGWEDLFFRILLDRIEPRLGFARPTFLVEYPASQAALARRKPTDPRVAERFELYVAGLELANGFAELTDAAEQRARFAADRARRAALYGEAAAWPADEDFLAALTHGLPDCAGIALGFDRLAMLATGAARIEDVLWLPVVEGVAEGKAEGATPPR